MGYKSNPVIAVVMSPVSCILAGERLVFPFGTGSAMQKFDKSCPITAMEAEEGTILIHLSKNMRNNDTSWVKDKAEGQVRFDWDRRIKIIPKRF